MKREMRSTLILFLFCITAIFFQTIKEVKAQSEDKERLNMEKNIKSESPIACIPRAMNDKQLIRHKQLMKQIQNSVEEVKELSNGYGFRFSSKSTSFLELAEFITLERLCCPFFNFALELEPDEGPLWLKITGRPGVKEFVQAEFIDK
jgi:hypothetical protein